MIQSNIMKKIICYEIKYGVLTNNRFEISEEDFKLDIKKCAKTHIKNGYKIYLDTATFNDLKVF